MDESGQLMTYWAGLAAFIAPCTLILVPFFLLYVIGMIVTPGGRAASASVTARWVALGFVPVSSYSRGPSRTTRRRSRA